MILLLGFLLYIFIVGIVIYRLFKYKFSKYNRENIGFLITSGILLKVVKVQEVWLYSLAGLNVVLLAVIVGGLMKSSKNSGIRGH
ncbi:hypothetical protein [Cohnella zeiphila]|uniref:Uncharacterized protein n=1 Tax=Cohnella zeiphila TaxID=2761120 RepID=A0A7X0SQP3_9BACL|nr:hypothetical protein [Cohnella zeiphila]MBB6733334.1 hypothetical protein [Cohnella zeiphila]